MNIRSLKQSLGDILDRHQSVALWFSGGSDSRLLLELLLEEKRAFGILSFDDGRSQKQRQALDAVTRTHNLQIFSYPAFAHTFIADAANKENLALASFYAIDGIGTSSVLLRDLVKGDKCAFDIKLEKARTNTAPIEFEAHIFGLRHDDTHFAAGRLAAKRETRKNGKTFYFPLFDLTKKEVETALSDKFGIAQNFTEETDTGNILCCFECFKGKTVFCPKTQTDIQPVEWDAQANSTAFKKHFIGES